MRTLPAGHVVLRDIPMVCLQHTLSRASVLACAHCIGFVSDPVSQLRRLVGCRDLLPRAQESPLESRWHAIEVERGRTLIERWLQVVDPGSLPDIPCLSIEKTSVSCDCGVMYCDKSCKDTAWKAYHSILCPSVCPGMSAYNSHALRHNERLLMAARVVGLVLSGHMDMDDINQYTEGPQGRRLRLRPQLAGDGAWAVVIAG
eukprot:NODE_1406_length_1172_cov_67.653606_g1151_i0.p1 GENE.NODE_1406_length_1172_cov_67.653606_g1151_i0~~NODE_1406_length_1172_cov_67.653606_g1151_i0.p1  ORF type:complete len:202 (+),score=30.77 NODE_1406_length_1172_cov_67.653606_g1151_i0:74-679(+)